MCGVSNKEEEIRYLQFHCKFAIVAIAESHLDSTVSDSALDIEGMKFLRLGRKGRKGGGFILNYAENLKATHRKDLYTPELEAAPCFFHINPFNSTMIIVTNSHREFTPTIVFSLNTEKWPIFILHREIYYPIQKRQKIKVAI